MGPVSALAYNCSACPVAGTLPAAESAILRLDAVSARDAGWVKLKGSRLCGGCVESNVTHGSQVRESTRSRVRINCGFVVYLVVEKAEFAEAGGLP